MNTKGNKRHQETLQRIYTAFAALLQEQELNRVSITELCEVANIERSTFCANFEDISMPMRMGLKSKGPNNPTQSAILHAFLLYKGLVAI